jgi:hypothetical protein
MIISLIVYHIISSVDMETKKMLKYAMIPQIPIC